MSLPCGVLSVLSQRTYRLAIGVLVFNVARNMSSIHTINKSEIYEMPMSAIIRPLPPQVDDQKVKSIMNVLEDPGQEDSVPPIDVLWITGSEGGNYYYSFGGCHRYEAHSRLKRNTIKAKLVKSIPEDLKVYLGSSIPDFK